MGLVTLVYFSEHRLSVKRHSLNEEVSRILRSSSRNNAAKDITGTLIYDERLFVQVLEGEEADVWSTFQCIGNDSRHSNVSFVLMKAIRTRQNGACPMGSVERTAKNDPIFLPYLRTGRFQPALMTGGAILSLAHELTGQLDCGGSVGFAGRFTRSDGFHSDALVHAGARFGGR